MNDNKVFLNFLYSVLQTSIAILVCISFDAHGELLPSELPTNFHSSSQTLLEINNNLIHPLKPDTLEAWSNTFTQIWSTLGPSAFFQYIPRIEENQLTWDNIHGHTFHIIRGDFRRSSISVESNVHTLKLKNTESIFEISKLLRNFTRSTELNPYCTTAESLACRAEHGQAPMIWKEGQIQAIQNMVKFLTQSDENILMTVGPTALSKTAIMHWTLDYILSQNPNRKILVITERAKVIEEHSLEFKERYPQFSSVVKTAEMDTLDQLNSDTQILFITLDSWTQKRKSIAFIPTDIAFDEAQHAGGSEILKYLKPFVKNKDNRLMGFTATPINDNKAFYELFDPENFFYTHFSKKYSWEKEDILTQQANAAAKNGEILNLDEIHYFNIKPSGNHDLLVPSKTSNRFVINQAYYPSLTKYVMPFLEKHKENGGFIRMADRDAAIRYHKFLVETGVPYRFGLYISDVDHQATLEAFDKGEIDFLITVAMLNEGFNRPRLGLCVDFAPPTTTSNPKVFFQGIMGRILRQFPGKFNVDLVRLSFYSMRMLAEATAEAMTVSDTLSENNEWEEFTLHRGTGSLVSFLNKAVSIEMNAREFMIDYSRKLEEHKQNLQKIASAKARALEILQIFIENEGKFSQSENVSDNQIKTEIGLYRELRDLRRNGFVAQFLQEQGENGLNVMKYIPHLPLIKRYLNQIRTAKFDTDNNADTLYYLMFDFSDLNKKALEEDNAIVLDYFENDHEGRNIKIYTQIMNSLNKTENLDTKRINFKEKIKSFQKKVSERRENKELKKMSEISDLETIEKLFNAYQENNGHFNNLNLDPKYVYEKEYNDYLLFAKIREKDCIQEFLSQKGTLAESLKNYNPYPYLLENLFDQLLNSEHINFDLRLEIFLRIIDDPIIKIECDQYFEKTKKIEHRYLYKDLYEKSLIKSAGYSQSAFYNYLEVFPRFYKNITNTNIRHHIDRFESKNKNIFFIRTFVIELSKLNDKFFSGPSKTRFEKAILEDSIFQNFKKILSQFHEGINSNLVEDTIKNEFGFTEESSEFYIIQKLFKAIKEKCLDKKDLLEIIDELLLNRALKSFISTSNVNERNLRSSSTITGIKREIELYEKLKQLLKNDKLNNFLKNLPEGTSLTEYNLPRSYIMWIYNYRGSIVYRSELQFMTTYIVENHIDSFDIETMPSEDKYRAPKFLEFIEILKSESYKLQLFKF